MQRIAIVTNYIPDYRYPVFKRLADTPLLQCWFLTSSSLDQSCQQARDTLHVKYSITINVANKTHHANAGTTQNEYLPIPVGLFADLVKIKPDVIVAGDFGLRSLVCWMAARLLRARFVLWAEEIAASARGRSWLQLFLRRFLTRRADACLGWGTPAQDYLLSLGLNSAKLFGCAQAIDNDVWIKRANKIDREQVRHELNLDGTVFLFVGRLVERKGISNFLQAWKLSNPGHCATAVIVGTGSQEVELKEFVDKHLLSNVRFSGRQVGDDLARYYAAADIFVFPSLEDVWGLVVNEALCFGLPILGSKFAGSTQSLLTDNDAGLVFDPTDIKEFADHISKLSATPPPIDRQRGQAQLASVTFDESYRAISAMLAFVQRNTANKTMGDGNQITNNKQPVRVTIIQQVVPHYRVAFFRKLHARLQASGIELRLLYGNKARGPADTGQILIDSWARSIDTIKVRVFGLDLIWQSALRSVDNSELVIVEQSNRLLINYLLHMRRKRARLKLAYWGHGRNLQAHHPLGVREQIKRRLLGKVDWWFAYTDMTRAYLLSKNFPASRITVVNNAVADSLSAHIQNYSLRNRSDVCAELGLSGDNVALFCGGLYKQKRLEFLLLAAERIRSKLHDFELLVIGEGPDRKFIEQAAQTHNWIHYAGAVYGTATAKYWYATKLLLMPGLVGLVIVDSFIAGRPIVTTSYAYHSPEIAYLESGVNGLKTDNDVESFADGAVNLLNDDGSLELLKYGCTASAHKYTLENMVENFAQGIESCLS